MSAYETLAKVDVNEYKAKKGGFDYLSWADAVNVLQQHFPDASWEVREWDGLPFTVGHGGAWVCVTVTIGDVSRTQWHPILDHRNRTIPAEKLDAFAINTSIQRCLAKAIALHGLGLYIFRGEDFPVEPTENGVPATITDPQLSQLMDMIIATQADEEKFCQFLKIEKLEHLKASQFGHALAALQAKAERGK